MHSRSFTPHRSPLHPANQVHLLSSSLPSRLPNQLSKAPSQTSTAVSSTTTGISLWCYSAYWLRDSLWHLGSLILLTHDHASQQLGLSCPPLET